MSLTDELVSAERNRLLALIARQGAEIEALRAQLDGNVWASDAGTAGEVARRLRQMPDFPVHVGIRGTIACPRCRATWDDADLALDACTIASADDIEHCVSPPPAVSGGYSRRRREWVQITLRQP